MTRIALFLVTNVAIMIVISLVFSLFGLSGTLQSNGVDLDLNALLLISMIVGVTGSVISLAMSKSMAKRSMGVQVIDQPQNQTEEWLVSIVSKQAQQAGIGMPEVGIFDSPTPNAFATGATKNSSLVAVSSALLDKMSKDEIEGVVAHEMAHILNGDMVTMTLLQ